MADISQNMRPVPSPINPPPAVVLKARPWDQPRSDPADTPHTPTITAEDFDALPDEMRHANRWLVWCSVPRSDQAKKPRKVPFYTSGVPRKGELDSPTDRTQLGKFNDAIRALQSGKYTGLGFALGPDGTGNVWQGIDLDDMPNRPALGNIADDLPGYTETSPSGKGMHSIGYGKPFASLGSNATGIEAYARGRFFTVTGVGSGIHPPTCLADFVETRLKPMHGGKAEQDAVTSEDVVTTCEVVTPQTITELRSAMLSMRADDRECWVRMGHALKTLGDVGRGMFLDWSATSLVKFDPIDAAEKWESFKPTRTGYQAVFAEAQRQGWLNPARHLTLGLDLGGGYSLGVGEPHSGAGNATSVHPDPLTSLEQNIIKIDSLGTPVESIPHYVDRWIPHNEVTLLAGHGGGGKSYVALGIAVHVVLGLPFGDLLTTRANVLFFSAEDGAQVLRLRLSRICRALKIDPAQLEGKLHLLDASDIDPALHREQRVTVNNRQTFITETALVGTLAALVQKLDAGLVIVDNASDAYDDDEIKRARVRAFIRSLRSRIARPGRAVLLLAHINKAAAKEKGGSGSEDYSGSTAWHNSVRSRLSLVPSGDNALTIEHMKANLGAKAPPVRLEWHDGVPLVAGTFTDIGAALAANLVKAAEKVRDDADKVALVALMQDFDKRGELVTTSIQGPATVFKLIKTHPDFPKNTGSDRLTGLLRALETEGRIYRRVVRSAQRKPKEIFTCAPLPETAPIPDEEERSTERILEEDCANELV